GAGGDCRVPSRRRCRSGRTSSTVRDARERRPPDVSGHDLLRRISIDPRVCFGKPCIRGARIWVSLILDNLAEGVSVQELLGAYPQLTADDIRAVHRLWGRDSPRTVRRYSHQTARMKVKLDENLSWKLAERLHQAGHEVATVEEEGLGGTEDHAAGGRAVDSGNESSLYAELDRSSPDE